MSCVFSMRIDQKQLKSSKMRRARGVNDSNDMLRLTLPSHIWQNTLPANIRKLVIS